MTKITGVILAGGESQRFGSPKAFAIYRGKPFVDYAFEALKPNVHDIMIVSHPKLAEKFSHYCASVVEDDEDVKGKGPLAGLYTAMNYAQAEWYFILPCDVPKINALIVQNIIARAKRNYEAIIPIVNGKIQPLIGMYSTTLKSRITQQLLTGNYRILSLLEKSNVQYIAYGKGDEEYFINVNDQRVYKKLEQRKE